MEENTSKKGFKVIGVTALILKIITIITIIALICVVGISVMKNVIETKEFEDSQVIAEIEYTDDVAEFSDLEVLQNVFKFKIYDNEKANNHIIAIASIAGINCIFEFVLLILIFDSVQKIFINLYKTVDGINGDKNRKKLKNIGIYALLKLIVPLVLNIISRYMLSSTIRGNISLMQIVFTLVIVITAFIAYYKTSEK